MKNVTIADLKAALYGAHNIPPNVLMELAMSGKDVTAEIRKKEDAAKRAQKFVDNLQTYYEDLISGLGEVLDRKKIAETIIYNQPRFPVNSIDQILATMPDDTLIEEELSEFILAASKKEIMKYVLEEFQTFLRAEPL